MPILPITYDRDGEPVLRQLMVHSAINGKLHGNNFNPEGKWLSENQPTFLCGAVTDYNGTEYRPSPGERPVGHGYSLRHPGTLSGDSRAPLDKMSVWALTNRAEDDQIFALFAHIDYSPGLATTHDYPNEIALIDGWTITGASRALQNYSPLISRNSDYTFDFDSLLNPSSRATWTEFQATENTPRMVVLATDRNQVMAIDGETSGLGLTTRQLGLNPPQFDIGYYPGGFRPPEPIPIDTKTPIGPQLGLRFKSGSGDGPADFSKDPDEIWDIQPGDEIEVDMGFPTNVLSNDTQSDSRIFVAIYADDAGSYSSAQFEFYGSGVDPETAETTQYTLSTDDPVTITGKSIPCDAGGNTVASVFYVDWSKNYVSAYSYRRDQLNATHEYPTIKFVNAGTAHITKIVAFRAGKKMSRDDIPTSWHVSYMWEKRFGSYKIRGGHSGDYEQFQSIIPANHNLRMFSFSPPLQSEVPTHMHILMRAFNSNIQEADESEGVANAFTIVKTIPIRITDVSTNTYKTNTGYASHDLGLDRIVVDNHMDSVEIGASAAKAPGGLLAAGGCWGVAPFGGSLLLWGFPRYTLSSLTFTQNSKIVTSDSDDFHGWFVGRQLVYQGKSYTIRRVMIEDKAFTATLVLQEAYTDATSSGSAYLAADNITIYQTIDDGVYGECICLNWAFRLPNAGDEIMAIRQEGPGEALVFGRRFTYRMTQSSNRFNVYLENPIPPVTRFELVNEDNAAAGPHCVALVEGRRTASNGRGLSMGLNASTMTDVTSAQNARLWKDLFSQSEAERHHLTYDNKQRHLLITNVGVLSPTFGMDREYGAVFDLQNDFALSLYYPWPVYASGVARLAPEKRSKASARMGTARTRHAYGPIIFFADVATVGTGGAASQTGPHVVVYDTRSGRWSASPFPNVTQIAPIEGAALAPLPGGFCAAQLADGSIIAKCAANASSGSADEAQIRLTRSATGAWSVSEQNEGLYVSSNGMQVYSWRALRDKTWVALRTDPVDADRMAVFHYAGDTIASPYVTSVGGRYAKLEPSAADASLFKFSSQSSAANNRCLPVLLAGGSGELYVFDYNYSTKALVTRVLDERTLLPARPDFSVTLSDPGSPTEASPGSSTPGRGPRAFVCNRHGEIFFTERTHNSGGDPRLSLNRLRLPCPGYAGGNTVLKDKLTTPEGLGCLLLDQRQQLWFAHDYDAGSGRTAFKVFIFAESDTALSYSDIVIERANYHRRLQSMIAAGNYVWYFVKDTPTAGGSAEWRLIKAIGESAISHQGSDYFVGDGRPSITATGGASQEEDAGDGSIFFDVAEQIAGTGGSLSYCAIDNQMERALHTPDQANATDLLGRYGLGEI